MGVCRSADGDRASCKSASSSAAVHAAGAPGRSDGWCHGLGCCIRYILVAAALAAAVLHTVLVVVGELLIHVLHCVTRVACSF